MRSKSGYPILSRYSVNGTKNKKRLKRAISEKIKVIFHIVKRVKYDLCFLILWSAPNAAAHVRFYFASAMNLLRFSSPISMPVSVCSMPSNSMLTYLS